MKALSMKQPVPELILQKKKTIETRTWNTKFRGEFYIHASQSVIPALLKQFNFRDGSLPEGVIIGKAEISDVKKYNNEKDLKEDYNKHLNTKTKKFPIYGYILKNVKRLEKPIRIKGKLGFFEVDV